MNTFHPSPLLLLNRQKALQSTTVLGNTILYSVLEFGESPHTIIRQGPQDYINAIGRNTERGTVDLPKVMLVTKVHGMALQNTSQ